jgi:hypothetical protein
MLSMEAHPCKMASPPSDRTLSRSLDCQGREDYRIEDPF